MWNSTQSSKQVAFKEKLKATGVSGLSANKPVKPTYPPATAVPHTASAQAANADKVKENPNAVVPKNLFERVRFMIKEYGLYAISIYATLWIVPAGLLYQVFYSFDNFGHNPVSILTFFHLKDTVFNMLGLPEDAKPEAWQISTMYAYLGTELFEVVRLPAALWLAPKLKRFFTKSATTAPSQEPLA